VIYTSGSTGAPKGVMVTHRAAWNTVEDINRRFGVGPGDRVLGVANLSFDLSVYDLFGPLAVGGALVLPEGGARLDPSRWAELMVEHGVTVWNSVPAQMQMLCDHLHRASGRPGSAPPPLRLVLLSGDWIPLPLPAEILGVMPDARVVSLGGATEAAIWSIFHPVDGVRPEWRSIPYGRPLTNQTFHVLDADLADCPDWVTGELFIGGAGLARGYLGDEDRTRQRFIRHPRTGERLYRTGDLGRYRQDGEIEFLGREDAQVKIRGYRIELAEVEAAFQSHPGVRRAVALVQGDGTLDRRLIAVVEPSGSKGAPPEVGSLLQHAAARLPAYMLPSQVLVARSLPLTVNGKIDRTALLAAPAGDEPGAAGSDPGTDEPRDELERRLAEAWATTLGATVSRSTDFFDAGGDSLLAGKVVGELMDAVPEAAGMVFDELLVHVLEQRTVAALAERLRRRLDESRDRPPAGRSSEVVDFGGPDGGPAYVVVHDAGGGVDAAFGLVKELAARGRTIAVVRSGGTCDNDWDGCAGLEALATDHVAAVNARGPFGSVQVVGYGTGARLAFEVARELGEVGCAVDRLCVIDGAVPGRGDDPSPFVGDVTLVVGTARPDGDDPAWWRDHCLGAVDVVSLPGDVAGSLAGVGADRVVRALRQERETA
jgi:pyochelin synthetase